MISLFLIWDSVRIILADLPWYHFRHFKPAHLMAFGTLIQAQQYKSNVNEAFNHGLMLFFSEKDFITIVFQSTKNVFKKLYRSFNAPIVTLRWFFTRELFAFLLPRIQSIYLFLLLLRNEAFIVGASITVNTLVMHLALMAKLKKSQDYCSQAMKVKLRVEVVHRKTFKTSPLLWGANYQKKGSEYMTRGLYYPCSWT